MYLKENPVLQRELLANLRMGRAFWLLLAYVSVLGAVVLFAWPEAKKIDMTNPEAAKGLVNLFFLGQYLLASLMAPSFAAGAITGEKERRSYEMLLASPLRPGAIVMGKLLASLSYLAILIFCSLPIVLLCLPLGGVNLYEVLAVYLAVILSTVTFGMISLACSSYFRRTASSLVVSYLLVLPLGLFALLFWQAFGQAAAGFRLFATVTFMPAGAIAICSVLFAATSRRLLHPPDVGSEGKEVVDESTEQREAVGLVIQRDKFPDKLFAPAKRDDLLADGANPIFDKEMRSEIFSQGTLMLRVVIQMSMLLAVPLMAWCLFLRPDLAPWYISYVLLFNILVGPVFSAGSMTSERERETLDLLLVTTLSPWQILWGKLISGWRVSSVLTGFLLWPLVLACVLVSTYRQNMPTVLAWLAVVVLTSLTTSTLALFCSVVFRKTSVSMMASYVLIVLLFIVPVAALQYAETIYQAEAASVKQATFVSPFAATFSLPLENPTAGERQRVGHGHIWAEFVAFDVGLNAALVAAMIWLFSSRWRVASRGTQ
ncbi:MAG: ABC transporter permease subunit [Planctomycetia bacterium]|nr:ABC transporter permease subunit [Planctomycetia bacterium]